jgi:hypothetical protein
MKMRLATLMLIAVALVPAPAAAADDLAGKWTIDGDVQGNAFTLNCTVTQGAAAALGGECEVNGMTSELSGNVKDSDVQFSITVSGYTLTYTGKVQGDSMEGGIEVAGATGTFSGKRAKA